MLEERIQLAHKWKTESEYWNECNICIKNIHSICLTLEILFANAEFDCLKFPCNP